MFLTGICHGGIEYEFTLCQQNKNHINRRGGKKTENVFKKLSSKQIIIRHRVMKWHHWLIIVLIQIGLVALGLYVYHLLQGGTGIDTGLAITVWAAVITIVFIVFSVLGIMNIDGKIKEVNESKERLDERYSNIEERSNHLIQTLEESRTKIVKEAEAEIKKMNGNTIAIQHYYQRLSYIEAEPNPDRRIVMFSDLMSQPAPPDGIDKGYLYLKRGANYMLLGLYEKAKADFETGLELCSEVNKCTAYSCLADYYVAKKDYPKSVEFFKKALEKDSSSSLLFVDLGNSLNKMKQFDEADENYNRALAINPELAGVYYNKALRLHERTESPTPADQTQMLSYLEKCISIDPTFFVAYINKAAILREQGKEVEATEVLSQIVTPMFNDDIVMAILQRGIAYRVTNNQPKALNDFRTVLFHRPHDLLNLSNLAFTYLDMGLLNEADYYARLGLKEANEQENHRYDGDLYQVQQTVMVLQGRPPLRFNNDQPEQS